MAFLNLYQLEIISGLFCLGLIHLSVIDFRTMRLPDHLTMPLMAIGISFNHLSSYQFTSTLGSLIGAALGYTIIWLINLGYKIARGKAGIGMGDAKLLACIGALLGPYAIIPAIFIASILGIVGGLIWLKTHRLTSDEAFPFGPYLSVAGITQILDSNFKIGIIQYLPL